MNQSILFYCLAAIISTGACFTLTPLVASLATQRGLCLDIPDARRIHKQPVPRCGGIAIFFAFHLSCLVLLSLSGFGVLQGFINLSWWQTYFAASSFLLLVGLFDDLAGLSWLMKLEAQVLIAVFLFSQGISVDRVLSVALPNWLDLLCTIAWFVGIINAFNLIDGLDGLATGLAICGALGLALMAFYTRNPADAVMLVAFIGACLAFLRYNFHPAQIFLGDSGSMFLGLTLATVSLSMQHKATALASLLVPLLAVGVPLFDTLLAIWRRSVRMVLRRFLGTHLSGSVVGADLDHLHHRLVKAGFSQRKVALSLYGAALALVVVGTLSLEFSSQRAGILVLALVAGMYVVVRHVAHTELWDSGMLVIEGLKRPSSHVIAVIIYPALDVLILNLALLVSIALTLPTVSREALASAYYSALPIWCGLPFVALVISRTYSRVWSRARITEFALLAITLLAAVCICFSASVISGGLDLRAEAVRALLFGLVAIGGVIGLRVFPKAIKDMMGYSHAKGARKSTASNVRELIYGAGMRCQLYLTGRNSKVSKAAAPAKIVGLVDDDRNLRRRYVFGYQVLGESAELPQLLQTHAVRRLVIACDVSREKLQEICTLCNERNVELKTWRGVEAYSTLAEPEGPTIV